MIKYVPQGQHIPQLLILAIEMKRSLFQNLYIVFTTSFCHTIRHKTKVEKMGNVIAKANALCTRNMASS